MPILVFDGGLLPAKQGVELSRQGARDAARWRAATLLQNGAGAATVDHALGGSIEVTPDMAAMLIRELQVLNVDFLVAPYEADAQLAHLALTGRVDVCATEDADLLAYGCPRVIFGLQRSGHGREVRLADLPRCRGLTPYRITPESLPDLCVLTGCDYLPSIKRLGIKTAARLLHRSGGNVQRALHLARLEGFAVPADYGQRFEEALLVFASQTVFDPELGRTRPLRPLPECAPSLAHLGAALPDDVALGIARGRLNPLTKEPFEGDSDTGTGGPSSSQSQETVTGAETPRSNLDSPVVERGTPLSNFDSPVVEKGTPSNLDSPVVERGTPLSNPESPVVEKVTLPSKANSPVTEETEQSTCPDTGWRLPASLAVPIRPLRVSWSWQVQSRRLCANEEDRMYRDTWHLPRLPNQSTRVCANLPLKSSRQWSPCVHGEIQWS
uniref:XPG-I domain-containing protein n=1 Tax=Noctiluca scintillans TaxID=2966 RepID=A0A7S0ZP48_NOCSC